VLKCCVIKGNVLKRVWRNFISYKVDSVRKTKGVNVKTAVKCCHCRMWLKAVLEFTVSCVRH
jgi:hypothetical protein